MTQKPMPMIESSERTKESSVIKKMYNVNVSSKSDDRPSHVQTKKGHQKNPTKKLETTNPHRNRTLDSMEDIYYTHIPTYQ